MVNKTGVSEFGPVRMPAVRNTIRITDRERSSRRFRYTQADCLREGVYVIVKLLRGDLVALDRDYEPLGFVVDDPKMVWAELFGHPAMFMHDPLGSFKGSTGIEGEALWFDFDH